MVRTINNPNDARPASEPSRRQRREQLGSGSVLSPDHRSLARHRTDENRTQDNNSSEPWYDNPQNVRALIEYLIRHDWAEHIFADELAKPILHLLEKPWKWTDEWHQFLAANPDWRV